MNRKATFFLGFGAIALLLEIILLANTQITGAYTAWDLLLQGNLGNFNRASDRNGLLVPVLVIAGLALAAAAYFQFVTTSEGDTE